MGVEYSSITKQNTNTKRLVKPRESNSIAQHWFVVLVGYCKLMALLITLNGLWTATEIQGFSSVDRRIFVGLNSGPCVVCVCVWSMQTHVTSDKVTFILTWLEAGVKSSLIPLPGLLQLVWLFWKNICQVIYICSRLRRGIVKWNYCSWQLAERWKTHHRYLFYWQFKHILMRDLFITYI